MEILKYKRLLFLLYLPQECDNKTGSCGDVKFSMSLTLIFPVDPFIKSLLIGIIFFSFRKYKNRSKFFY